MNGTAGSDMSPVRDRLRHGAPDAIGVGGDTIFTRWNAAAALRALRIRRFAVVPSARCGADRRGRRQRVQSPPDGTSLTRHPPHEADTLDKIRPEDLRRNAAAIALLGYVLAER